MSTAPAIDPARPLAAARPADGRFPELQGQRGLAALCIVVFHVYQYDRSGPDSRSPLEGTWAHPLVFGLDGMVDWFFVLSGSVLLTLGDREIIVNEGEAAEFSTMTPHRFVAHDGPAEIISIFDRDGQHAHLNGPGDRR